MTAELKKQVEDILAGLYPSYHEPLRIARQWNRGGKPDELEAAALLLDGLRDRNHYPTALRVWYEAAFNRMQRDIPDEALRLLTEMDRRFGGRLDADTHALFGRYYKRVGHDHLDTGLKAPERSDERAAAFARADLAYSAALAQYERGYALDHNWFPGINAAFVLFARAALAVQLTRPADAERLLLDARNRANELLTASREWPKKLPDDDVWHAATCGEAHALTGDWVKSVRDYQTATDRPGLQEHHAASMGGQLSRIVQCCKLLSPLSPLAPDDLGKKLPKLAGFLSLPSSGAV